MHSLEVSSEMVTRLVLGYKSNGKYILGLRERGLIKGVKGPKGHIWEITLKGRADLAASTNHVS